MENDMYSNFELYYPNVARQVDSYLPTLDPDELMIVLKDGSRILYNDFDNSVRNLPSDSNNMSEGQCKREFGFRLKKLMYKRCITQEELSNQTGITQAMISRYICGESLPSFYNTDKIAKALGCSIDEFRYI